MKKIVIAAAVLAVLGAGGYFWKARKGNKEVRYASAQAVSRPISEFVETTGAVTPQNRVEIEPSSSGRIEEILVKEGDRVRSGEVLALMSSQDRVAILDAARAGGEEQYKHWQDTYRPIKIISPLDGTIILKNVVEGQTVGQSTVLFALSDKLILKANVDESDVGRVREGQAATIVLDSYPDKPVKGRVFQILDEGTNQSNVITYTVKIRPDSVPPFFRSQMTANIKIEVSKKRDALLIPAAAVTIDPGGKTAVIAALKDGAPVYRRIETGVDQGDMVEVVRGLEEGDTVMYSGKGYRPQQAQGANPLMPARPNMPRGAGRALH